MKKLILLLIILTVFLTLTACTDDKDEPGGQDAGGQDIDGKTTIKTELTVWGMTCNRCENKIITVVSALDGVTDVSVDLRDDKVTVEHKAELDIESIKKAIEAEGFNTP